MWGAMVARWEKDKDAYVHDFKSPEETEPLRLRVVEADLSITRNMLADEHLVQQQAKAVKNISEEDLQKLIVNTLKNHDFNLGEGFDPNMLAQRMVSNAGPSGGAAFQSDNINIDDVTALVPEEPPPPPEEPEGSKGENQDDAAEDGGSPGKNRDGKKEKDKSFNLDVVINTARRALAKNLELQKIGFDKTVSDLQKEVEQVNKLDQAWWQPKLHIVPTWGPGRVRLGVVKRAAGRRWGVGRGACLTLGASGGYNMQVWLARRHPKRSVQTNWRAQKVAWSS